MRSLHSHIMVAVYAALGFALISPMLAAGRGGTVTAWLPPSGNWSESANWSEGEPNALDTAEIPPQSTVLLDQVGEECLALHVGTGSTGFGALVSMTDGSLTVGDVLRIGTASSFTTGGFTQLRGTVSAALLRAERGGYTASGGTATFNECVLDRGSLGLTGGNVIVTTTVTVETGAALTIGGGTFAAGSGGAGGVTVRGEVAFVNPNAGVTLEHLTLDGSNSRLRATIGALGFDPFTVTGTFARDGRFIVNDVSAPYERYDILTAGEITGDFAEVELPATGEWSWGVENTTLFVVKEPKNPVAESTWGGIKVGFAR